MKDKTPVPKTKMPMPKKVHPKSMAQKMKEQGSADPKPTVYKESRKSNRTTKK